jgi:hypothetical protein
MAAKSGEDLNRDAINTPAPAIAQTLRNRLLLTKVRAKYMPFTEVLLSFFFLLMAYALIFVFLGS